MRENSRIFFFFPILRWLTFSFDRLLVKRFFDSLVSYTVMEEFMLTFWDYIEICNCHLLPDSRTSYLLVLVHISLNFRLKHTQLRNSNCSHDLNPNPNLTPVENKTPCG